LHAPLDNGRVVTKAFNPSDLPQDFDSDLDPIVSKLQWDFAIDVILTFLRQPRDPVVVFEHPFATPDAKWLDAKEVPYVTCGTSVLFVINSSWADRERIELTLEAAGAQNELGILARHTGLSKQPHGTVAPTVLEELEATIQGIVLRAFDAEGYLVWLPRRNGGAALDLAQ
jgi:hypothetical protein